MPHLTPLATPMHPKCRYVLFVKILKLHAVSLTAMKKEQAPLIQQSIAWHLWMPRTLNDTSQA